MSDLQRSPTAPLRCTYLSSEAFDQKRHLFAKNMFGAVCFMRPDDAEPRSLMAQKESAPLVQIAMPYYNGDAQPTSLCEIWHGDGPITHGVNDVVHYSCNDELLFGVIQIDEAPSASVASESLARTPLEQASKLAYAALFETTDKLGYSSILRVWNYIPDINVESFGIERYKQFNNGRHEGFLSRGRAVKGSVPAASAVGVCTGPLTICFFASRQIVPVPIENPRQVSAYLYPTQYGATSPTFSRANVVPLGGEKILFISGTASIVGHETLHAGDLLAQAHETLANISIILDEANRIVPSLSVGIADLCCKVYVREAAHIAALDAALRAVLGSAIRLIYLQADICRAGLLMEIEATAGHPVEFAV